MPERGLEPPLPCENCDLNAARLPVPPLGHECLQPSKFIVPTAPNFVNATRLARSAGLSALCRNLYHAKQIAVGILEHNEIVVRFVTP